MDHPTPPELTPYGPYLTDVLKTALMAAAAERERTWLRGYATEVADHLDLLLAEFIGAEVSDAGLMAPGVHEAFSARVCGLGLYAKMEADALKLATTLRMMVALRLVDVTNSVTAAQKIGMVRHFASTLRAAVAEAADAEAGMLTFARSFRAP